MYDELVNRLRADADYMDNNGIMLYAAAPFYRECADVIEELSREYESVAASLTESVELVRKLQQPRWIPVSERLPGREWVLCKCRAKIHEVLSLRDGYWYHDPQHQYMSGFVTHWMPLPKPPRGNTDET